MSLSVLNTKTKMNRNIGIIGLGTVGEATLKSLKKSSSLITKRTSLRVAVKMVCDKRREKKKVADKFSIPFTTDAQTLINNPEIDIVVELIGGFEPARKFVIEALKKGKDVVTANKALLATYGKEIFNLARQRGRNIGFEASVCGAIPLIRSISEGLVGCEVRELYGILNGTTNYILYKMHKERMSFEDVLKEAQSKGLAERKPDLDIKGIDTLHKLAILSYLCFGFWPPLKKVYVEGISRISLLDIIYAEELSYRIKLLALAKKDEDGIDLRVHPTLVPEEHPLSQVNFAYNAVWIDSFPAGKLLFHGVGAGGVPTSSAVISDIVNLSFVKPKWITENKGVRLKSIGQEKMRYYIRFMALDRPGVLSQISRVLAVYNISIASVTQKERKERNFVPIVMITHEAKESSIRKALARIDKLSVIKGPSQIIRIIGQV